MGVRVWVEAQPRTLPRSEDGCRPATRALAPPIHSLQLKLPTVAECTIAPEDGTNDLEARLYCVGVRGERVR